MILRSLFICTALCGWTGVSVAADTGSYKPSIDSPSRSADAPLKSRHRAFRRAPYRVCCGEYSRFVYAESWYGSQKVIAPVRRVERGMQVLLPGGPWVDCELSCEYTLRKQTLSFWERQPSHSGASNTVDSFVDGWGQRHGYLF